MSTLAERRAYQVEEREAIAQIDPDLTEQLRDEPSCLGCGCSQSLACPEGCGWAEPGLCSACDVDGVKLITPAMTLEQARHVAAYLRASIVALTPDARQMWERTPVGQVWATINAFVEAAECAH